jgi:hypothetical protein
MSPSEFFAEVEEKFHYLHDEYGFSVADEEVTGYFDACEITLRSKDWHIRIGRDRGALFVYVGPTSRPDIWFDLGILVTFLERDSEEGHEIWFGPRISWSLDYDARIDLQLRWYADELRLYSVRIAGIFQERGLDRTLADLQIWKEHKDKQAKDALARGDYPDYPQ